MQYDRIKPPASGTVISINADQSLNVPDQPRLHEAILQPIRKTRPQDKDAVESELEQLIPGATLVGTRGFGKAVIRHMDH